MPTYNGEKVIADALESVRQQCEDGIELIVVDDGSTDRTPEIVRDYANCLPIRLITPGRSGNWAAATNIGLRAATGEWACFLHQDDFWFPGRIARVREELGEADGALVLHDARFAGPDGQDLGPWTCPLPRGIVPPDLFLERLLIQNFLAIPSPLFRRSVAVDSGGLDESLWFSADWDFWLRLGAIGPVHFIPEQLAAFRVHPESQTAGRRVQPGEWEEQLKTVLFRHLQNWKVAARRRNSVERAAMVSIAVNSELSAVARGEPARVSPALIGILALGPPGWRRYLRDSRIVQRVRSRLRMRRLQKRNPT